MPKIEDLPNLVSSLHDKVDHLTDLFSSIHSQPPQDRWFDLNELVEYDPEKRSKATFYSYTSRNLMPYHRRGKKITILKSEFDKWQLEGRKKTIIEREAEADKFLLKGKRR
jgi:hypothetical protein